MRKASDMVLLLGSRGRGRPRNRSAFWSTVRGVWQTAFGRPANLRTGEGRRRGFARHWPAGALALLCFAGGFFAGGEFQKRGGASPGQAELVANGSTARAPGVIGEVDSRPMSNQAFVVAAYPRLESEAALEAARVLAERLRTKGFKKARPYEFAAAKGPLWVVAVYFDGPEELAGTRDQLLALRDDEVGDAYFVSQRKATQGWPVVQDIR